jgi:hypothetical protein
MPKLSGHGVAKVAALITEAIANTYPRLPVREGEHVHVTLLRLDSAADHAGLLQLVSASASEVLDQLTRSPESQPL